MGSQRAYVSSRASCIASSVVPSSSVRKHALRLSLHVYDCTSIAMSQPISFQLRDKHAPVPSSPNTSSGTPSSNESSSEERSSDSDSVSGATRLAQRVSARFPPPPPVQRLEMVSTSDGGVALPNDPTVVPLPADDDEVHRAVHFKRRHQCARCARYGLRCNYVDPGVLCAICALLGYTTCSHADPALFLTDLSDWREDYLLHTAQQLHESIQTRRLLPGLFNHHYFLAVERSRRIIQGAITRFRLNVRATDGLVRFGYNLLINSTTDLGTLSRFTALGDEVGVAPSVLQMAFHRSYTLAGRAAAAAGDDDE
uniref:Zn(2)-C6 fungal-type domain-containing protein n=1 Tax=Mycena chlorophos TaxID=658473 RepID=A0ABQ0L6E3_MYCCL|nr:predicted protein [Mycena chlorophos]